MSVKSFGDGPYIPKDSSLDVGKKHTTIKPHKEKSQASHVYALKSKITVADQTEISKKSLKLKKSKKSTLEDRERKPFTERAKEIGFKFNEDRNMYQSINEPGKQITIEEMENLIKDHAEPLIETDTQIPDDPTRLRDTLGLILLNLNSQELNEARLVCQNWSQSGIPATIVRESLLVKSFVELLASNLDKEHGKQLNDLFSASKISQSNNLEELRSELINLREKIVILLINLTDEDLKKLKSATSDAKKPEFFDKFFALVPIYKEMDEVPRLSKNWEKENALTDIIRSLVDLGCLDKALQIANEPPNKATKEKLNYQICKELVNLKRFDEAIELSKALPLRNQEYILKEISVHMSEAGECYKAIQKAHSIKEVHARETAYWNISKELCRAGKFEEAINIVYAISILDEIRDYALMDTAKALAKAGRFNEALRLSNTIREGDQKEETLKIISIEQAKAGKFDEAIKTAKTISDACVKSPVTNDPILRPSRRAGAYKEISLELSKVKRFDKAIELAKTISDENWRNQTLSKISADMDNASKSV